MMLFLLCSSGVRGGVQGRGYGRPMLETRCWMHDLTLGGVLGVGTDCKLVDCCSGVFEGGGGSNWTVEYLWLSCWIATSMSSIFLVISACWRTSAERATCNRARSSWIVSPCFNCLSEWWTADTRVVIVFRRNTIRLREDQVTTLNSFNRHYDRYKTSQGKRKAK